MRVFMGTASRYYCGLPGVAPFHLGEAERFKNVPRYYDKACWLHAPCSWLIHAHEHVMEEFLVDAAGTMYRAGPPKPYHRPDLALEVMRGHLVHVQQMEIDDDNRNFELT